MRLAWWMLVATVACSPPGEDPTIDTFASLPGEQAPPPPYVIDSNNALNDTANYYVSVSGNWTSSTNVAGYYNTGYWVAPAAFQYDPAQFYFRLDADACLIVESWWTSAADRAPNVPYQNYNAAGTNLGVTYVDQRARGGQWNEIGRYIFTSGWNRVIVSRWADLGTNVIADAVRVRPANDCAGWCGPDSDGDGVHDCQDACPADPGKTAPGVCGCGSSDADSDGDGFPACQDACPADPGKTAPGVCGCGSSDADSDGDGFPACQDACPADPGKTAPGVCGCGVSEADGDGDGTPNCADACPVDPAKADPGVCGCGAPETDGNGDGIVDCSVCGDGVVQPGEACDDSNTRAGDGCGPTCRVETVSLNVAPARAGRVNTLTATSARPGAQVWFAAAAQLGSTPVPGCPRLSVPVANPTVIGGAVANNAGTANVAVTVPAGAAGRTYAMVAVETSTCRASTVRFVTF